VTPDTVLAESVKLFPAHKGELPDATEAAGDWLTTTGVEPAGLGQPETETITE